MFIHKRQLMTVESTELSISKEERYELIAMIAQRYQMSKVANDVEQLPLWDSNDTDLNFEEIVNHYN